MGEKTDAAYLANSFGMSIAQCFNRKGNTQNMALRDWFGCAAAVVITALLSSPSLPAMAQEMEIIAGGELEYQKYCAVCHGTDARGNGIMGKFLTVKPANLRQLRMPGGGMFPFWEVYQKIDGQNEIRGHGARDMPVWGERFRAQAGGGDKTAQTQAAGRILSLVFYLQHIQE